MTSLPYSLERSVSIAAPRELTFRYLTDSERFAAWWGPGSLIEAVPDGKMHIVYPGDIEAGGQVKELKAGRRMVFTYGYASGQPIPLGSTRVEVSLHDEGDGCRLDLRHELADETARDAHVAGWAHRLAVLANAVSDEAHQDASERLDRFFAIWAEADGSALAEAAGELLAEEFRYHDLHASLTGREAFCGHVLAAQRFFPGARVERVGEVRSCQGRALVDWRVISAEGQETATGTNAVQFTGQGLLGEVTSFWNRPG